MSAIKLSTAELILENARLKQELIIAHEHITRLENKVAKLSDDVQAFISGSYWEQSENERGAGRKSKINDELVKAIHSMRFKEGLTIKAIACKLDVSVGLVHKVIKSL